MVSRTARTPLIVFLLIVGSAGAYLGYDVSQRHDRVFARERDTVARLDAMLAGVNELAVTQRGYFEPREGGSATGPQFARVRQLTDELRQHLEALRGQLTSPEAIEKLTMLGAALTDFTTTDARVRTSLANETYFSAADLVFSASANELQAVTGAIISLKALVGSDAVDQYGRLRFRGALVAATVGAVWTIGLLLLAWPRRDDQRMERSVEDLPAAPSEPIVTVAVEDVIPPPPATRQVPSLDLEAVARTCTALASATSATALREILADASSAVSASGMIVWLGAGEELFAVMGHGYDPRMLRRLGPIPRQASNATATAWRLAHPQLVAADSGRPAAVVVPLVGSQGCIGALSAELSSGRDPDASTQAVMALLAAQLSTIVAAWPQPSGSAHDEPGTSVAASL